MSIEGVVTMLPVDNVAEAARIWEALLGVAPRFVDGERWAQFEIDGKRIALAGTDRLSDRAGVMLKVADIGEARTNAMRLRLPVTEIEEGPHELRFVATGPGGNPVVFYSAKPRA